MNLSYFTSNQNLFATLSRKSSKHNFNADRKSRPNQTFNIDRSLCRNLFGKVNTIDNGNGLIN